MRGRTTSSSSITQLFPFLPKAYLALLESDLHGRGCCVLRGRVGGDDLKQLHLVHGGEVVHADHQVEGGGEDR